MRLTPLLLPLLLAACDCSGIVNFCPPPQDTSPPPPPTMAEMAGTACVFGEWPAPACLRYRSRTLDDLCARGQASVEECAARRTDLPLPPAPRARRPLLPPA